MANFISNFTGSQIDAAVGMAHEHPNKALLDAVPLEGFVGDVLTKTEDGAVWAPSGGSGGQGLKAQGGRTETSYTVQAGKYLDIQIGFPSAYITPPGIVTVCFETASTAAKMGLMTCAVLTDTVTRYGFTVRVYNADTSNRVPYIRWMAIGV